jgi:hypothetical protein
MVRRRVAVGIGVVLLILIILLINGCSISCASRRRRSPRAPRT